MVTNAYQQWLTQGFEATGRAKTIAMWLRGLAGLTVLLGLAAILLLAADSDTDTDAKGTIIGYIAMSVAVSGAVLAALGAILDLVRIQTESVLFSADDEADTTE